MRTTVISGLCAVTLAATLSLDLDARQAPPPQGVEVSFDQQGRVTLTARNVTVRGVLAEWSRVGGCEFVNAQDLTDGPIPILQFENQPEATVIASLLRSAAGYVIAPRTARTSGASMCEAVVILATSSATTSAVPFAGVAPPPDTPRAPGSPADEIPPVTPIPTPADETAPPTTPSTVGTPSPGVFVPIVPVNPGGRGGTPPPTTGRGGRGGGSR